MLISKEELAEFKAIWKDERGEEISDTEAQEEASNLLNLCRIVLKK